MRSLALILTAAVLALCASSASAKIHPLGSYAGHPASEAYGCRIGIRLTTRLTRCAIRAYAFRADHSQGRLSACRRLSSSMASCNLSETGSCWLIPGGRCGGWNTSLEAPNCGLGAILGGRTFCSWSETFVDVRARYTRKRLTVWIENWSNAPFVVN